MMYLVILVTTDYVYKCVYSGSAVFPADECAKAHGLKENEILASSWREITPNMGLVMTERREIKP